MRQRGFSMTELVLVIIVTGILAVVVVPAFTDSGEFRARGFSDEVQSAARHAQKLAIASACPVQLTITADDYTLSQLDGCTSGTSFTVQHPARSGGYTSEKPSSTTLTSSAGTITFHADGSSTGGTITTGGRTFNVVTTTGYVYE